MSSSTSTSTTPMCNHIVCIIIFALLCVNVILRVFVVALSPPPPPRRRQGARTRHAPLKTLICLGSGGHTAEMFAILRALDPQLYTPRTYVLAATDTTSASKVERFESEVVEGRDGGYGSSADGEDMMRAHTVTKIPRSREVGQNYFSSVFTTLYALVFGVATTLTERPDVILCNGPGTCIPLCAAAFALRVLSPVFPRRGTST